MKLLLVRHGESEDDIINAYGGWADFHLTDKGKTQIGSTANEVLKLGIKFDILLTSPLHRALESAEILSKMLQIPTEIFEYVKERNTYGILCGMAKEEAKKKYPWLVDAYEKGEYVEGSERIEDIDNRVKKAFELIKARSEENIIVVTHGVFLKSFFPVNLNKQLTKKGDGGFILLEIKPNNVDIIKEVGISVQ